MSQNHLYRHEVCQMARYRLRAAHEDMGLAIVAHKSLTEG